MKHVQHYRKHVQHYTKHKCQMKQQCTNRQKQSNSKNDHWCTNRHMSTQSPRPPNTQSHCSHTPFHLTPPLGEFSLQYCHPVWHGKTRMVGLPVPDDEKNFEDMYYEYRMRICIRQNTGVYADGRTDILPRHSPRYAYASRAKS